MRRLSTANPYRLTLLVIVLVAAGLRLYGQDWDEGHYLHPDERFIAMVSSGRVEFPDTGDLDSLFDPETSPINPRRNDDNGDAMSFAYGSLPIYVQGVVSWALNPFFDQDLGSYSNLNRVGRTLTALLDLATLVLVYLLGRRLFGELAGLTGAALYGFAVLPIQLSHFFTVDPWLTTFVTAALYLAIRYLDRPLARNALLLGIVVGCTFATKASVPALLAPLLLVFGYVFWKSSRRRAIASHALLAAGVALAVFTLFEPYALARRGPFVEDIRTQARIVRGIWDVPFTRQFVGLTPGVYELENLFRYTIGPGLLLVGIAGLGFGVFRIWKDRDVATAIPIIWVVAYIPTLLITEARFPRYSMPLIPMLAIFAGGLIWAAPSLFRSRNLSRVAAASVIVVTAIWAFGFVSIYRGEHPRIAASEWIHENVPNGAVLTAESWDDALPLRLEDRTNSYTIESLDIYGDLPPEEKVDALYDTLLNVDYVVMSSDRLIYSVDNLPWRYAVQNEFYRRLLDGQLGFQLAYQAEQRPELFGIGYDDSGSDESFTVYDHPRVHIFERVEDLSREEFRARLLWGINQSWEPTRYPSREWLLLDEPVGERSSVSDIGWSSVAVENGIVATIAWLFVLELFGLAVLPWSASIFQRSPDRGALAARLLGILTVGWIVWIGSSLGLWPATTLITALVLLLVGVASWSWRHWSAAMGRPLQLPTAHAYFTVFGFMVSIFALFLLFRALYPDFWQTYLGGEKPFELAYLRAVAASPEMPPYDPWYSDGVVNYYYYGWHLVSTIGRLPGVGITHAFQLAVPTFAALVAMQVALVASLLNRMGIGGRRRRRQLTAAGLAVVAVAIVGNLDAVRQLVEIRGRTAELFDFWGSTRVIDFTINEFPYFSLIWADVHPHVLGLPVIGLVLALLVATADRIGNDPRTVWSDLWPAGIAGILAVGSVFVINAWDLPLTVALTVAGLTYAGLLRSRRHAVLAGAVAMVVTAAGYAIFLPFHVRFYSVVEGVAIAESRSKLSQFLTFWGIFFVILAAVILFAAYRGLRHHASLTTAVPVASFVLVAAGAGAVWSFTDLEPAAIRPAILAVLVSVVLAAASTIATRPLRFHPIPLIAVAILAGLSGFFAVNEPAAGIALAFASSASMFAVHDWKRPARFLPWAFVAVGCLTIASVEFVYVVDDLQGGAWQRMNTVFKFYLQSWTLIAIGTAVLLGRLLWSVRFPGFSRLGQPLGVVADPLIQDDVAEEERVVQSRSSLPGVVLSGLASCALLLGLVYPVFATPVRLRQDMPSSPANLTLDGYAWMERWQHCQRYRSGDLVYRRSRGD